MKAAQTTSLAKERLSWRRLELATTRMPTRMQLTATRPSILASRPAELEANTFAAWVAFLTEAICSMEKQNNAAKGWGQICGKMNKERRP
jgi:hypothetical protein